MTGVPTDPRPQSKGRSPTPNQRQRQTPLHKATRGTVCSGGFAFRSSGSNAGAGPAIGPHDRTHPRRGVQAVSGLQPTVCWGASWRPEPRSRPPAPPPPPRGCSTLKPSWGRGCWPSEGSLSVAWTVPLSAVLLPHIRKFFLRKKMKFIKGARTWRSILGTQTFFWPLTPPPTPPPRYSINQPLSKGLVGIRACLAVHSRAAAHIVGCRDRDLLQGFSRKHRG